MKKRLHKIFAFFLIALVGVLCVGCGPDTGYPDSLKEQYENGQLSFEEYLQKRQENMTVPLYGTKILYRPDDYDWKENVGKGNSNYYEQYSWWLLKELMATYGYVRTTDELIEMSNDPTNDYAPIQIPEAPNPEDAQKNYEKIGYFDTIRYQLDSIDNVTLKKIVINDDGTQSEIDASTYAQINADINKNWVWSFGCKTESNISFMYSSNFTPEILGIEFFDAENNSVFYPSNDGTIKNNILSNVHASTDMQTIYESIDNYFYALQPYQTTYANVFLGTNENGENLEEVSTYSEFVKALEYIIYCINLDLNLDQDPVHVTIDQTTGLPAISIDGYPATEELSSVDRALAEIKQTFEKIGTYVGVTPRQQQRLVDYICDNIIGADSDDNFQISSSNITLAQYVKVDSTGHEIMGSYQNGVFTPTNTFDPQPVGTATSNDSISVQRHYRSNIEAIVDICTTQVRIGNSNSDGSSANDDDPTIEQQYLASHIIDYYGNDFFISGNNEFKFDALEYQSMALMFSQDFQFSNLMLGFQYDADDNAETVDPNASITINVHMHLYTHSSQSAYNYTDVGIEQDGTFYTTFQIEVKDGPFSFGDPNNTMMLFGLNQQTPNGLQGISLGKWDTEIGGGILNSISDGYTGLESIGTPLPLSGNNARREFYNLIDGESDNNHHYSYGILNPDRFTRDPHNCDYFEIAFEVVKVKGDKNKNYKFNTGIMLVA